MYVHIEIKFYIGDEFFGVLSFAFKVPKRLVGVDAIVGGSGIGLSGGIGDPGSGSLGSFSDSGSFDSSSGSGVSSNSASKGSTSFFGGSGGPGSGLGNWVARIFELLNRFFFVTWLGFRFAFYYSVSSS